MTLEMTADLATVGIQIQEMPVSSAIMTPWNKEVVAHNGHIEVTGKPVPHIPTPQLPLITDTTA